MKAASRFRYQLDKIVTKLLTKGIHLKIIIEILEELNDDENDSMELNLARKKTLLKK